MKWKDDGHELAYHSLSQSIKDDKVSFKDFETFNPPNKDIPTWIDHGYQPYNFSLYKKHGRKDDWYEEQLKDKSIAILWNYIDSGTATKGVINQINPEHFTLKKYVKGIKSNTPKIRYAAFIKNIMFHFYNGEKYALNYKDIAKFYKLTFMAKKPKYIFNLLVSLGLVAGAILKIFLTWNSSKTKTYPLAKYTPVLFKHKIKDEEFSIFQTIEMVDFKKALCKENIDLLIEESGLFIAHTYFSVPMGYHTGKLLRTPSQIDEDVEANFSYLAHKIANNEVWNPTLKQLISYFDNIENAVFSIDSSDNIYLASQDAIPIREIN
ncbi:hypothetical protein [Winogradskyella sp.]|uniref:hypothetical protein n=1 Tax=Winogradskyella sp. TaxID=1883156 RepID=UPI003BA9075D